MKLYIKADCPECEASGMVRRPQYNSSGALVGDYSECQYCNGKGWVQHPYLFIEMEDIRT